MLALNFGLLQRTRQLESNRAAKRRFDTEASGWQDLIIRSNEGKNQNGFTVISRE